MISQQKKNVVGVLVDAVDRITAANLVIDAATQMRPFAVSALAVHGVMTGVLDPEHLFRLNQLDLVVADGQPVRWALNLLHKAGLNARVYGPDLMMEVLGKAAARGVSVFFYGSTQANLDQMSQNIRKFYPNLSIAGTAPSLFGRTSPGDAYRIADNIRQSGAQIVFVGLGCPRQEVWAYEFRERLQVPVVAVGAAFPFLAGTLSQAPRWMQDYGFEWLFRFLTEPRRLWRRYLLLSPAYTALVICQLLGSKFLTGGEPPHEELLYG